DLPLTYGKYTEPSKTAGAVAALSILRSARSGRRNHSRSGERPTGKAKVVCCHSHFFVAFLCLGGTTLTENDGNQRWLRSRMRAATDRPAKTCSGSRTSSSTPFRTNADATPEMKIAASIAETMM